MGIYSFTPTDGYRTFTGNKTPTYLLCFLRSLRWGSYCPLRWDKRCNKTTPKSLTITLTFGGGTKKSPFYGADGEITLLLYICLLTFVQFYLTALYLPIFVFGFAEPILQNSASFSKKWQFTPLFFLDNLAFSQKS